MESSAADCDVSPRLLPDLPVDPAESVPAVEHEDYVAIVKAIAGFITREAEAAPDRRAQRDAHPKMHGVVRAKVTVRDDVRSDLRRGVFAHPGRTYDAWIRFSNGSSKPSSDHDKDGRGMAIKLCGVDGTRLADDTERATQDFVMIDSPAFFVADTRAYVEFAQLQTQGKVTSWFFPFPRWPLVRWREALIARRLQRTTWSPLAQRYFSMTPLRLGPDRIVKVSARPLTVAHRADDERADDFLRRALVAHLERRPARFVLEVQPRVGLLPIEDARVKWPEDEAPFVPVADIEIPVQTFDSAAQRTFGQQLSFSPWHCLADHRPLGSLNRVRRQVYAAIAATRHQLNGEVAIEPTGTELFADAVAPTPAA